jgi:hypothetical protein
MTDRRRNAIGILLSIAFGLAIIFREPVMAAWFWLYELMLTVLYFPLRLMFRVVVGVAVMASVCPAADRFDARIARQHRKQADTAAGVTLVKVQTRKHFWATADHVTAPLSLLSPGNWIRAVFIH